MPAPRKPKRPFPSQRYGAAHREMRRRLGPVVARGETPCARCGELIAVGQAWELDHRDDGHGWLGPSHRGCNRSAGWEQMVRNQTGNGNGAGLEEQPYTWSQRWFDDPPVGTIARVDVGLVEVHMGGGVWQTRPRAE
jgi:hypothetical protein